MPECVDCIEEGITTNRPTTGVRVKRCATHVRARATARKAASHERRVQQTYGLAPGTYERLYAAQDGLCGICGPTTGRNGRTRRLSVDHDHACCPGPVSCGSCVRGLLCRECNTIVGRFRDDPACFTRGADYIKNPPARKVLAA